jgi:tetratricopeptide (TPR) repeat protein
MSYRDDAQSLQLAFSLHRSGKFAEAAKLYRKVIKKNPREANALYSLALIEATAGNRAEAAQLMARSLAMQPKNIQFIQNYVTVLCQIGKFETASTECRRGLMCRLLATGRASIGIFAAEGGQFLADTACRMTRACAPRPVSLQFGMASPSGVCERGTG